MHAELKMFMLVLFFLGAVSDRNDKLHEDVSLGQDAAKQKNGTDLSLFEIDGETDVGNPNFGIATVAKIIIALPKTALETIPVIVIGAPVTPPRVYIIIRTKLGFQIDISRLKGISLLIQNTYNI